MSDYLFGKNNLAKRAVENIEKYRADRQALIKAHIQNVKADIEKKVLFESRTTGNTQLEYNISKFALPKEHAKIKVVPLETNTELDEIVDAILSWCKEEGLKAEAPGRRYNSLYYKTNLRLSWDLPEAPVTPAPVPAPVPAPAPAPLKPSSDFSSGLVQIR